MTTDPAIYAVGLCIGRGTIISMLLVMGILPGILLLGDTIIDRTTFNIKYPAIVQTTEAVGMVRLDGRIRGTVSGKIDAEVHGVLMGEFRCDLCWKSGCGEGHRGAAGRGRSRQAWKKNQMKTRKIRKKRRK